MSQDPALANPYWHQPSKRQRIVHEDDDDDNAAGSNDIDTTNLPPPQQQSADSIYPHNLGLLDGVGLEQLRSMTQQFEQNLNEDGGYSHDINHHSDDLPAGLPPDSHPILPPTTTTTTSVPDSSAGRISFPDTDINVGWLQHHNISALDGIASQILDMIARNPYPVVMSIYSNPESQDFSNLMSLLRFLNSIRNMYTSDPFFSVPCFQTYKNDYHNYIIPFRKSNMAIFIASIYGFEKTHFYHLDKYFLDTFAGNDGFLLVDAANIFLNLKTQAFISAITVQPDGNKNEILDYLFPQDIAKVLLSRRDGDRLSPTEQDFIINSSSRRHDLNTNNNNNNLISQYDWDSFVSDFSGFAYSEIDRLISSCDDDQTPPTRPEPPQRYRSSSSSADTQSHHELMPATTTSSFVDSISDVQLLSMSTYEAYVYARKALASCVTKPQVTAALAQRRPQSSRQTWTSVEEKALCDGLDLVKGPYWSQILELYGPNGKIDDALKGRNAVQLKDKARNLKLVFLKVGKPIPEPLRSVTGKLKTNTSKKESEKKNNNNNNGGQRRASGQQLIKNQIPISNSSVSMQPAPFTNYTPPPGQDQNIGYSDTGESTQVVQLPIPLPDGHNGISDLFATSSTMGIMHNNNKNDNSPASIPESSVRSQPSEVEQQIDENGEAAMLAQLTSDPNALMNLLSNMGSDLDQASFERLIQLSAQSLAR